MICHEFKRSSSSVSDSFFCRNNVMNLVFCTGLLLRQPVSIAHQQIGKGLHQCLNSLLVPVHSPKAWHSFKICYPCLPPIWHCTQRRSMEEKLHQAGLSNTSHMADLLPDVVLHNFQMLLSSPCFQTNCQKSHKGIETRLENTMLPLRDSAMLWLQSWGGFGIYRMKLSEEMMNKMCNVRSSVEMCFTVSYKRNSWSCKFSWKFIPGLQSCWFR